MRMNIDYFKICGLFGKKDVTLSFKNKVQIYVGENGLGKTTVLNLLYYVLTCKFDEMLKINFTSVSLKINGKTYDFTKTQIQGYVERNKPGYRRSGLYRHFQDILKPEDIAELKKIVDNPRLERIEKIRNVSDYMRKAGRFITNISAGDQYSSIIEVLAARTESKDIFPYIETMKGNSPKILYFPTYRRIEIDKENIRKSIQKEYEDNSLYSYYDSDEIDEQRRSLSKISKFIHMGMDDFVERKNVLLEKISSISRMKLNALSTDIIKHEIQGYPDKSKITNADVDTIKTLLSRSHIGLEKEDLERVIATIKSGEIFDEKNKVMLYVLLQLLDIYKSYAIYDRGLKQFVEVCNHYLNDKKLVYDEVGLDLFIKFNDEKAKSDIGFDLLSSGEKQIISMLSEVFLDPDNNFIFLIDEPELSLSIFWQKMLIPDIMSSGRCSLLFAVTHSPYIFDNEYDSSAVGMNEFVEFNKKEL